MTQPFAIIIEDDPKLGKVFEVALQRAGFETALDANGDSYLGFLNSRNPALIILDMYLPFASGQEILAAMRAKPDQAKIPVIIVTADLFLAKSFESKGEKVLLKPFSVSRLAEAAAQFLPKS
jgi:two-component system, OmpR family, response regulator RegX3